ncbi:MAG: hypothetical protein KF760_05300 [Candidatus Eremiobacteraeota bacterium]|nr:hypothetical protein [Candidatus Eremiobacteraeota bacterium]MCW5867174.1 hypothetical protein [Candidatus Eremiobacteraeota bacterium]
MRIWLHFCLVLLSCALIYFQKPAAHPEAELQRKAQGLLDSYYGRGHARVWITRHSGRGQRTVRDQQLGDKGFVVQSQERHEGYQGKYTNEARVEKLELPHKLVITHQEEWLESTDVAVVVDRDPGPEIVSLLAAGLGLQRKNGDQIQVVRTQQ